jgi:quercetin dioxygenase-like cupin family protein
VLKGQITIFLGNETFDLDEGDSIYFPGNIAHGWENNNDTEAVTLWAVSPSIIRTTDSLIIGETNYVAHPLMNQKS